MPGVVIRLAVDRAPDPGLAEVVPAGPGEVADHVGVPADRRPAACRWPRDGSRCRRSPGSGRARRRWRTGSPCSCSPTTSRYGRSLRPSSWPRRAHCMRSLSRSAIWVIAVFTPVSSSGSSVAVLAALGQLGEELGAADQQPADGLGDEPRGVERPDLLGQRTADTGAHRRPGLGDLVADAVEDHARVVEVLADHGLHVRLPPVGESQGVVVLALRLRPHVEGLVHDEHARDGRRRRASACSRGCGRSGWR